ncbi:hypothetical protein GCM10022393_23410 [Aquimarina addita]|uniref:Phage protein n=1 Tax=Aquimarina addita TaxID=870485 RepID=A0ABP6UL39_9FLAO
MKKNKQKTMYTIDWASQEIWKKEVISKEFIKHLTEIEVQELVENDNTQLGIISERDRIEWIQKEESFTFWDSKIKNHICEKITKDEDDYFVGCDYEEFKGEYFFVASLWKMIKGKEFIILEHYH